MDYRTIGHLFGVGLSTACVCVRDVCSVIVDLLAIRYIMIPSGQILQAVVDGFQSKWGFPQCVGAIDGSHIPIIAPKENPVDYFNRNRYHSVILQALVDHEYMFLDIYVSWPGSVHDARVLANSTLYNKCESGDLFPNWTVTMGNTIIPLVILGDPAYPLRSWLLKPFSDTGLSRKHRNFNLRLSRARVVCENAFGRLKGRWKLLMKRNDGDIRSVPTIVTACCVLHNLCEMNKDACKEAWICTQMESSNNSQLRMNSAGAQSSGIRIWEALCDYFEDN